MKTIETKESCPVIILESSFFMVLFVHYIIEQNEGLSLKYFIYCEISVLNNAQCVECCPMPAIVQGLPFLCLQKRINQFLMLGFRVIFKVFSQIFLYAELIFFGLFQWSRTALVLQAAPVVSLQEFTKKLNFEIKNQVPLILHPLWSVWLVQNKTMSPPVQLEMNLRETGAVCYPSQKF